MELRRYTESYGGETVGVNGTLREATSRGSCWIMFTDATHKKCAVGFPPLATHFIYMTREDATALRDALNTFLEE